ncbi:IPExxxVDY family protein [Flavobacterium silvaticum]|uniref:IPExxxVDY family protein n=1 Tax=Flavobacterium silvaticum TaxID=1852020 RepID=A0A972FKX2_9FLAO|nr:IPExxxVDY family protein [Flavobacterium silvaticum]NMH27633.1 IPExxxVDY family protein [Flavobacterium silvaticum]
MALHKLLIDEFDEIDYRLIAIHTSLEEYRLAFLINQKLRVLLNRCPENIQITAKTGSASLSRYVYDDENSNITWNLLQNKSDIFKPNTTGLDLFSGVEARVSSNAYLIPEHKKVDFFLQLQNTNEIPDFITPALQQIPQVTMTYSIDISTIKSRNNLIF